MIKNDIKTLLVIQDVDVKIDELEAKREELPERLEGKKNEIKEIENGLGELKKKSEKVQKERKLLELDIESNLSQIKKLQGKIYEVKTNKEYVALQDEIEVIKKANSQIEEKTLSRMFDEDEVKKEMNNMLKNKTLKEKELVEIEKECNEEIRKVEDMLAIEKQKRSKLMENVDRKILNQYERIRKTKGGIAVAKINRNICSECFMEIRPQLLIEISKDDKPVLCESCFRILYIEFTGSSVVNESKAQSKL